MPMDEPNADFPRLTENDKRVLKKILDQRKLSDSEIAKRLNLSPQAIFKIRNKLESVGVIKGYVPNVNYKKIGINVMVVLVIKVSSEIWADFSDEQLSEQISKTPYVIDAYRVADEHSTHILVLAFRDTGQKEKYISQLQTKYSDKIHVNAMYTFSIDKIIMHGSLGILNEIIDRREFSPDDLFSLNQNKKSDDPKKE
jgi:DNA-binding Lrp family transcriptional regulator